MSVHSNWPEARQPLMPGDSEPPGRWAGRTVILLLALVAVVVLCLTGVVAASLLRPNDAPPTLPAVVGEVSVTTAVPQVQGTVPAGTPGQPRLEIQPRAGYVNTLITVTGIGWSPGEPVFIFLRTPQNDPSGNYAYAAAVADDRGSFRTALTFPNEARWSGQSVASVVARGSRSGLEASAPFDLVVPTATSTVPLPTLPPTNTATPTRPVTDTPTPTPTPTATETPTPTPVPVITDWLGEYFAGRDLGGAPIVVRNDTSIDFNWGLDSPAPGVPVDGFSARWTRQLNFREAYYRFTVWADDGIRLWLDGDLLIDQWQDGIIEGLAVERPVSGGTHSLRVEYYENTGGAMARFLLERVQPPTATPSPTLSPTETATPTSTSTPEPTEGPPVQVLPASWQGEYYDNPMFEGDPFMVRTDAEINFDWGEGAPAEGMPADGFSVRWTASHWLPEGQYRFLLLYDGLARLIIDDQVIVDLPPVQQGVDVSLSEGTHFFQVDLVNLQGPASVLLQGEVATPTVSFR